MPQVKVLWLMKKVEFPVQKAGFQKEEGSLPKNRLKAAVKFEG